MNDNINYYAYDLRSQVIERSGCNAYCRETDMLDVKVDEVNGKPVQLNFSIDGNKLYMVGRLTQADVNALYDRAKHTYSYYSINN